MPTHPNADADRSLGWIPYGIAAMLTALYLLPCLRAVTDLSDEGISLLGAARVVAGQLPARDFVEAIGPGDFYWLASLFKLFGTTVFTARLGLLLTAVLFSGIYLFLAKRAGAPVVLSCSLLTAVSIPVFARSSYHWESNLFALFSFAALICWQREKRAWQVAAAGALAGVTALVMQQKGLVLCAALCLSAVLIDRRRWKKSILMILAPYLTVLGGVCAFYAARGAFHDLVYANLIWPLFRYSDVNHCAYAFHTDVFPKAFVRAAASFLPAYVAAPLGCFMALPILLVVAIPGLLLAAVLWLRGRAFSADLIPFWVCGWALWISECHRPDVFHLVFGSPILLLTLLALLGLRAQAWLTRVLLISVSLFALLILGTFLSANVRVQTRRGTIWVPKEDRALDFIEKHTQRGDYVFIYPYSPLYNFLSDTQNPTRYSYFMYGWHTPEQFAEAANDLERKRVRYVLSDTTVTVETIRDRLPCYHAPPKAEQIMERYLDSHYREIARENGYRILERIP